MPHARRLHELLSSEHDCEHILSHAQIRQGDVLFLLSCEKILPARLLSLHAHNIVVHESALPAGRGWAPLTWQILEGKNSIPVTLLEAVEPVDSGVIHLQDTIEFTGTELCPELRDAQGRATLSLCQRFIAEYPPQNPRPQQGDPTFYPKRGPKDSRLDPGKSIADQFDLLRVCDNERYPAWFEFRGQKYILRIEKAPSQPS